MLQQNQPTTNIQDIMTISTSSTFTNSPKSMSTTSTATLKQTDSMQITSSHYNQEIETERPRQAKPFGPGDLQVLYNIYVLYIISVLYVIYVHSYIQTAQ